MSEPLLNVMKIMLLCGLYLFFLRVLWSVFSELRDPRTVARKQQGGSRASRNQAPTSIPNPAATMAPVPPTPAFAGATAAPVPVPVGAGLGAGTTAAAPGAPSAAGQLRIIDPPELVGHVFNLGRQITLGRAPTNGIILDDTYVSTVHARIFITNGAYFVEDLSSRNGSTINGQQIVATSALVPGDQLQVGATTMEFS